MLTLIAFDVYIGELVKQLTALIMILPVFLLSGCVKPSETIKDIREIQQDHLVYIDPSAADREIAEPGILEKMDARFDALYFTPWHQSLTASSAAPNKLTQIFDWYEKNPGFGENGRIYKKSFLSSLRSNAGLDAYPNAGYAAITTDNTDLRVLPTHKPYFRKFNHLYQGYPFDKLQESVIAANTPLFVSHVTGDKAWVLAETPYATGWISSRHVASVSADFMKQWEKRSYAVIIRDKTPVYDDSGLFLFEAPLGSLFPYAEDGPNPTGILVATADIHRKAVIKTSSIPREAATAKPMKLTPLNLARIANEMMGEAYGWGGLYRDRDCSATIRDMFVPFGIWLPRHSEDQAKAGGEFIDLQNLSPEERENEILKRGIPYLTLIWKKGHIMLYIGKHQGKALVFHNFWAVRTMDWLGRQGGQIVGHAAITTLHPGEELQGSDAQKYDYLNSVLGMTLLISPGKT